MECIITRSVWPGSRLAKFGEDGVCTRCRTREVETPLHRYWTCPANRDTQHPAVTDTQSWVDKAVSGPPCLWQGGLLPGSRLSRRGKLPALADAQPLFNTSERDLIDVVTAAGARCGIDGAGGEFGRDPDNRAVGTGLAALYTAPNGTTTQAAAAARVPGQQTVPRAESWGVRTALYIIPVTVPLTLVVDAMYVVHGMDGSNRPKYAKGTNGDIWKDIYQMTDARATSVQVEKVKSHIISKDVTEHEVRSELQYNRMVLNEMADAGAGQAADKIGVDREAVQADKLARAEHEAICRRLAAIEAAAWQQQGIAAPSRHSMLEAYDETTRNKLQEEAHKAMQEARAIAKAEGHRLQQLGQWDRCMRCACRAKHGHRSYSRAMVCTGYQPMKPQLGVYLNHGDQLHAARRRQACWASPAAKAREVADRRKRQVEGSCSEAT